ncbi:stage V sporulation protein D [Thomasclavelia cocleata]|nr:penicillin-binding transpeptidase domain-containing protein [Thomasclavelia cocleata]MCR1959692.1 penicillin-binding transpeptidase domain-containing protein [Thomasclavelia cocleata]NDO41115.1 stage V sporulation protein D [Thomasclavelia cocleata]PJN81639.1 stage V sporulation protein D [Thomasclavelia cocleata]
MIYEITKHKIKWVKIITVLIVISIILKIGYIQIIDRVNIYNKAVELWQRSFPVEANRGLILDSDNNVLATNLTTASLVVVPSQIKDIEMTAQKISEILNVDTKVMQEKLSKKVSIQRIQPEGRQLDDEVAAKIDRLKLPGVYLIKDTKRYYPKDNYLGQTLGFVGIDNQGLLGLELKYDEYLNGNNGSIDYFMDAKSNPLTLYPSVYSAPTTGFDLQLTIDGDIQDIVERELNNAYDTYNPDGIWALAMDPNTGKILAMACKPDFNPNDYKSADKDVYNHNIPIWKTYEPGSTFKIITFSSALNENLFDMDKDTYFDKGYEIVGGARIKSWKKGGHGLQTFREVLQNSSNPGFVEIGRRLGKDKLYEYVKKFGLTEKTGIDLPGESKGIMFDYDVFNELEQATVAFGQGISVTPMQLVRAVCACVNGGTLYKPYLVDKIIDNYSNDIIYEKKPEALRRVISEDTSKKVRDALETVVTDGGGKNAYIDGYRIGGKTGTAQKAVNGSYVDGGYILSFIGIAPIDDPKIVLYVAMDNPKNCVQYGGTTVAPIARKMLVDILPSMGIEKVSSQRQKAYTFMDTKSVKIENYIGKSKKEVSNPELKFKFIGEGDKVIDQLPRVGEYVEAGSTVVIMLG